MALQTRGFTGVDTPRPLNIPKQVGIVDVGAIDKAVRDRLATMEGIRRQPLSMALADETAQTDIAKEQSERTILGPKTSAALQDIPNRSALLAFEASPAMLEAKRQALMQRGLKQPSGDIQLIQALTSAQQRLAEDPNDAHAAMIVASLKPIVDRKGMAPVEAQNQRAVEANASREGIAAGNNASRETIATGAQDTSRANTVLNAAGRATEGIANRESREKIATGANETSTANANIRANATQSAAQAKAGVARSKLETQLNNQVVAAETTANDVGDMVDHALEQTGFMTAGTVGTVLSLIPGTPARNLEKTIDTIKANIGFETLNALRRLSATGGALGNVSDTEIKFLQSTLASLDHSQTPAQLRDNLVLVKSKLNESLGRVRQAYERQFGAQQAAAPAGAAPAAAAGPRAFANEGEAEAAASRGEIKAGDPITVGGVPGRWQ